MFYSTFLPLVFIIYPLSLTSNQDYINNWFGLFTLQVARLIEFSGLLHCCYLVQIIFAKLAGQPLESLEEPRTGLQNVFFWSRVLISLAILGFSFAVTLYALFNGQTTMWEGVPNWAAVIIFFAFMAIVGMLEGMQIAFFAVAKMTEEERAAHPWAKRTCVSCNTFGLGICIFKQKRVILRC